MRPPDDVLEAVGTAIAGARRAVVGPRWAEPDKWHLTLQFLGPVAVLGPVVDALAEVGRLPSFPARLGGAGAFPNRRRARVVWIGAVEGAEPMIGVAAAVGRALAPLGYETERGPFRPHLTVARLRTPSDVAPVLDAIGEGSIGPAWTVDEVVLYGSRLSSAGARYTPLARVPLTAGA